MQNMLFCPRFCSIVVIIIFVQNIYDGSSTEISESSHIIDSSLGFDVLLPVLTCNAKFSGYKTIYWYKDFNLLRNGSSSLQQHFLSLHNLLSSSEEFDNILKLQGYYWCRTEVASTDHKYLFKIKRIHTYVGQFYATQDSLGGNANFSLEEKILEKRKVYEREMQYILFGFLPIPNTFVHRITPLGPGLKIYFFLYVQEPYLPRMPFAKELIKDHQQLEFIEDYLNNRTDTDADYYEEMLHWTSFRGISVADIQFKSTRGCYNSVTLMPGDPPKEVTWPYAAIGETVIPEEICASKTGLAVTKTCMGDFRSGALWSVQYGKCDVEPDARLIALNKLYNKFGDEAAADVINKLKTLTEDPEMSVTDIHIAINTLKELSRLPDLTEHDVHNLFSVIDNLYSASEISLIAAKATIQLTNRILQIIDNIIAVSTEENKELQVTKMNLIAGIKNTKTDNEDHVIGIAANMDNPSALEFLLNGTKSASRKSSVYFLLPQDLIVQRESYLMFPCQISLVLFKDYLLFPDPKSVVIKKNYKVLPSPVIQVGLSGGPAFNLTEPVKIYFWDEHKTKSENPVCVHFDPQMDFDKGGWTTEGCSYVGLKNGFFHCQCNHLTIFSIVLATHPDTKPSFHMNTSVYVACGISILAVATAVLLYILSKLWRSTVDHHILFWLLLSFLCSLVLIFTAEIDSLWRPGCFLQAIVLHYFILVTFSWLLIQSILHQLRFYKKTDESEVPFFMLKCFFAAWGIPALIVMILSLVRKYEYHHHDNCWPNVLDVSEVALIPIVSILLLTLCINISAAYAISCRFKKDFLVGESKYNEPVLKFRIAVSIYLLFVLCWIFGYLGLHKNAKELQILFSITTIVTAYYVTLFFIFQEISFWDLCGKCKKDKEAVTETNDIVAYNAKSYNSTETN